MSVRRYNYWKDLGCLMLDSSIHVEILIWVEGEGTHSCRESRWSLIKLCWWDFIWLWEVALHSSWVLSFRRVGHFCTVGVPRPLIRHSSWGRGSVPSDWGWYSSCVPFWERRMLPQVPMPWTHPHFITIILYVELFLKIMIGRTVGQQVGQTGQWTSRLPVLLCSTDSTDLPWWPSFIHQMFLAMNQYGAASWPTNQSPPLQGIL